MEFRLLAFKTHIDISKGNFITYSSKNFLIANLMRLHEHLAVI